MNSEGEKLDLNQRFVAEVKIDIPQGQNEEIRIQKNEERLRNFWDNFKCSNIWIIGVPEEEEREQEIENLLENNEGKLLQSGKGNRIPGSPGSSESPPKVELEEVHTKAHHNYITQD